MRARVSLALAVGLALTAVGPSQASAKTTWQSSWSSARAASTKSGRPIIVDFYTTWCYWCKKLDSDVYPQPKVVKALGQFVPVKLDAEHEGKGLAAKYAIDGYPTLVVVAPNGEFVERIVGYHPADDFVQTLHLAVSDNTDYPILKAKVAANPTDIATSLKFANLLARREKDKELMPLLTSLEAANEAPKLADIYLRLGDTCVSNNQPTQATTWYDKVINVSTNAKQLLPAHMGLLQMEMAKRDVGGAIAELQSMLDIPNLPKAEKAGIQSMIDQINASASQ